MRVVKELNHLACKVTVFSWNGKFLIKLEQGPFEQTFKVSELDVLEEEIESMVNDDFLEEAIARFKDMGQSLQKVMP